MNGLIERWKERARALKVEIGAVACAYRDPRLPWTARLAALLVVAYALSPIDLIPDFIPVLGYLDDLLLLPLGVLLVVKLVPPDLMAECRARAAAQGGPDKDQFKWMAAVVVLIWLTVLAWLGSLLYRRLQ